MHECRLFPIFIYGSRVHLSGVCRFDLTDGMALAHAKLGRAFAFARRLDAAGVDTVPINFAVDARIA